MDIEASVLMWNNSQEAIQRKKNGWTKKEKKCRPVFKFVFKRRWCSSFLLCCKLTQNTKSKDKHRHTEKGSEINEYVIERKKAKQMSLVGLTKKKK